MLDIRARLSQISDVALLGLLAACAGGGEETPYRERPAYRAFREHCQRSLQSCGPEGLCEAACADVDVEQGGCQLYCAPHRCLSNDWTHEACIKCCAEQAHSAPDALSRCQKKCGELYDL